VLINSPLITRNLTNHLQLHFPLLTHHPSTQLQRSNAKSLKLKPEHTPLPSRQRRPGLLDDILLRPRIIDGIRVLGARKHRQRGALTLLGLLSVELDRNGDWQCRVVHSRFEDALTLLALAGDIKEGIEAAAGGCYGQCFGEDGVSEELCFWVVSACAHEYTKEM